MEEHVRKFFIRVGISNKPYGGSPDETREFYPAWWIQMWRLRHRWQMSLCQSIMTSHRRQWHHYLHMPPPLLWSICTWFPIFSSRWPKQCRALRYPGRIRRVLYFGGRYLDTGQNLAGIGTFAVPLLTYVILKNRTKWVPRTISDKDAVRRLCYI